MRVEISTDRTPTAEQQLKIDEAIATLQGSGMTVELIGTRPPRR